MKNKRILLISSSGGHWLQLRRLEDAFLEYDRYYACTDASYGHHLQSSKFYHVFDGSRWSKFHLIVQAAEILILLLRVRPKVVVTTGASAGFFAVFFARLLRMKTIWVDSIANPEELSLSGARAGKYADLWLTQWEHLSRPDGPHYYGSVL